MSHPRPPGSCNSWQQSLAARNLLADLAPRDVRLTRVRDVPGPDRLDWHPDSELGAAAFTALTQLRQQAVGPAFALAYDDCARAAALAAAQRAPTVTSAIAERFGDPARWHGYGAIEATRRFRANWARWHEEGERAQALNRAPALPSNSALTDSSEAGRPVR